jgi:hypothetical protein
VIYFHLKEHDSARDIIQDMTENNFARQNIAPKGGISRSSFSEIIQTSKICTKNRAIFWTSDKAFFSIEDLLSS